MARTRDVGVAIGRLLIAFNLADKEDAMPDHKIKVYEKGWEPIPGPILELAADRWIREGKPYFPKVSEITHLAEKIRRELLAANQFEHCEQCSEQGWAQKVIDGVLRVYRCECFHAHQNKLERLGVTDQPLALPPARQLTAVGDGAAREWSAGGDQE